jgi:hypothetical protein
MTPVANTPIAILRYSRDSRIGRGIHLAYCVLISVFSLFCVYGAIITSKPSEREQLLGTSLVCLFAALFHWILEFFVFRKWVRTSVRVFSERFEIHLGKEYQSVAYSEIREVRRQGLWAKLNLKSGKTVPLDLRMQGLATVFDAWLACDPACSASVREIRHRALSHELCGERTRLLFFGNWALGLPLLVLFVPAFVVVLTLHSQTLALGIPLTQSLVVNSQVTVIYGIVAWSIMALVLVDLPFRYRDRRRLKSLREPGEPTDERLIRRLRSVCYAGLLGYLAAYYAFDLNTIGRVKVSQEIPHLSLHTGQALWIDHRANCVRCPFALRTGDVILFRSEKGRRFARVESISETVRTPASIPGDDSFSVFLRTGTEGLEFRQVSNREIVGRVFERLGDRF